MSSPSKSNGAIDALFNSSADRTIARLNRVLSTAAGVDSTLLFTGYSLAFISAQLTKLADVGVRQLAEKMAASAAAATASLKPGETLLARQAIPKNSGTARLLDVAGSLKTFSGMCSDVRMFMRLWGLLKLWAGFKAAYYAPAMDGVVRATTYGKLVAMLGYLVLEHTFYLGSKGVLKGYTPLQLGKAFAASIWIFGGYLVLDYVRLYRVTQLARRKRAGAEKEDKLQALAEDRAWWNSLQVDLAYTPLTFHWGLPGGVVSDATVGALGAWAGFIGFREAWRNSA